MALRPEDESTEDDSEQVIDVTDRQVEKKPGSPCIRPTVKVEWSDDDAAEEFDKWKNRKSTERKRLAASKRKASASTDKSRSSKKAKKGKDHGKEIKRERVWGEQPNDDTLIEYNLPPYLQERRSKFDERRDKLKQAGLKLPPDYNDVEFSDDERLEHLAEKPDFPDGKPTRKYEDVQLPYSLGLIPAPISQWLRDYQVQGTAFLHELFVYQRGGILGDDMGLGKTVQVIAFLTAAYGKTGDERDRKRMRKMRRQHGVRWYPRTLIVCPGTLIQNWKSEFERWGWWHVDAYHGANKDTALQSASSGRVEVMITTYSTYRLNKSEINMIDWDCVVADECHMIKERKSGITEAMNEVNALCRIGLTGTAIQNKYDELWTLLNWTNPGQLGPLSVWHNSISEPLQIGQSHDATLHQLSRARKTAKKLVENLLPQFFLRRMKTLIQDQLPKKSDKVVFCPLTPTQANAYENFLNSDIVQCIKGTTELCDCGSQKNKGWCCFAYVQGMKWQAVVFPAIVNLQKISNHLGLLIPQGNDVKEKQDKDLATLKATVPDQWEYLFRNRDSILTYANPEFCGKWRILKKLLKYWHGNGDKVLVFSHSVRLLKMLQMLFNHTSYNVSYLDGAMTYDERSRTVDDFNSDPKQFVFLISTRAGGVGLNITSANKVVVVDPNWNPSYDLQAQDRAYRIGQIRDVEVFRLISAGTIEEIVYARQIYKQQQANIGYNASLERRYFKGIQEQPSRKGEIFGLNNLFEYQNNNIVLQDIINKTNVAESKVGVSVVDFAADEEAGGNDNDDDDDDDLFPYSQDSTDPDDSDAAISQLAALVKGERPGSSNRRGNRKLKIKKSDPIQAILSGAGVQYTHENSEVIGTSKVEARLSRRAQEAEEAEEGLGEEHVFGGGPEDHHHHHHKDGSDGAGDGDRSQESENKSESESESHKHDGPANKKIRYRFHPPRDVMRRQFCSMAKRYGFRDAVEFALVVEALTQEQRRNLLDSWYRERRKILITEAKDREEQEEEAEEEEAENLG